MIRCSLFAAIALGHALWTSQDPLILGSASKNDVRLSGCWETLGPFQIGTREATWGADPLENYGGFRNLTYDDEAEFTSSLTTGASTKWFRQHIDVDITPAGVASTDASFDFDNVDWTALQDAYGWAALQYQAWTRTTLIIDGSSANILELSVTNVLEFWFDDQHYFGGDFYGFAAAPAILTLAPGEHRLDIRLVRDVRAMGGVGRPTISIQVKARIIASGLHLDARRLVVPDVYDGALSSNVIAVGIMNTADAMCRVVAVTFEQSANEVGSCQVELHEAVSVLPGQSRTIVLRLSGTTPPPHFQPMFRVLCEGRGHDGTLAGPLIEFRQRRESEPHKVTFLRDNGAVDYAMLKVPTRNDLEHQCDFKKTFPVMVVLHGAGVDVETTSATHSLDDAGTLCAFVVFATGGSSWSGDDWHQFGFRSVKGAVAYLPQWMSNVGWRGPDPDLDRWIVIGHSNGGQGAWHILTHHPDLVVAAAPISGYSSIQNYVPFVLWQPIDPSARAVLEGTLLDYQHELLMSNLHGIPIQQQHGSSDDNVPPFHSRLLKAFLDRGDFGTNYHEVPGAGHWYEGVMTTPPLVKFYNDSIRSSRHDRAPPDRFRMKVARPHSSTSMYGLRILRLEHHGQLGVIFFSYDRETQTCRIKTINVALLSIHGWQEKCQTLHVNSRTLTLHEANATISIEPTGGVSPLHRGSRLGDWRFGGLDNILRAERPFVIHEGSSDPSVRHISLQIARNLYQYFHVDAEIADHADTSKTLIELVVGGHIVLPGVINDQIIDFGFTRRSPSITIIGADGMSSTYGDGGHEASIGAIFLRPRAGDVNAIDITVWGSDAAGLALAARLFPMLPGVGQPDFVVVDNKIMTVGAGGVLAMGFFETKETDLGHPEWAVSPTSYFT